jgi:hypothetical protein
VREEEMAQIDHESQPVTNVTQEILDTQFGSATMDSRGAPAGPPDNTGRNAMTNATATRNGNAVLIAVPHAMPYAGDVMDMFTDAADRIGAEWSLWPSNFTGEWVTTIVIAGGDGYATLPLHGETVTIGTGY